MKTHVVVFFAFAFLVGCGGVGHQSNMDHAGHNMNGNSSANPAMADHNSTPHGNSMDHSAMQSSPGAASAPLDLQFIDTMTVHHQGAVEMAMLAETRAQRSEVREFAANIISDQEREMARMSEWRDRWFAEKAKAVNMDLPGMSHGMGGMDIKKLESLKGNEFDIELLKQMIPHHEGAIEMAKALQKQDANAELKQLAADIIAAQEAEIKQMREWLSVWGKVK